MAKNDRQLLDGIIDDRVAICLPSNKRDEAFEYFSFEQIMKDFDLSTDLGLLQPKCEIPLNVCWNWPEWA